MTLAQLQSQQLREFKKMFFPSQSMLISESAENRQSYSPAFSNTGEVKPYSRAARYSAMLRLSRCLDEAFIIVDAMIQDVEQPRQRNQLAHLARALFKAMDAYTVIDGDD